MQIADFVSQYQQRIYQRLDAYLPAAQTVVPHDLHQAMRYATLGEGKRLRALLVYATGLTLGVAPDVLDPPAAAVEMVHAYSLIHDDLPAMDDDNWRRGKPSCHIAFNEALAILAGDALQSLAFATLTKASHSLTAEQQLQMTHVLAQAIGSLGMVGGQAMDLAAEGQKISLKQLETIHRRKTGALITASVELGMLASHEINSTLQQHLRQFADCMGFAFQVHDDIRDIEADADTLGKTPGTDVIHQKATYPALMGITSAKAYAQQLYQQAIQHLQQVALPGYLLQDLVKRISGMAR
ncbi:MAG: farnesyl diphosphate synthase [Gammaproteobacteria bacterium]